MNEVSLPGIYEEVSTVVHRSEERPSGSSATMLAALSECRAAVCAISFVSGGDCVSVPGVGEAKLILIGAGRGHRDFDASNADAHQRTNFQ